MRCEIQRQDREFVTTTASILQSIADANLDLQIQIIISGAILARISSKQIVARVEAIAIQSHWLSTVAFFHASRCLVNIVPTTSGFVMAKCSKDIFERTMV